MRGVLRFMLGIEKVPDKTIDDIDKSLPVFDRLIAVMKEAEPMIKRCAPHIQAMKPDLIHLFDLVGKAWPDIESVLPTVDEIIDYAEGKNK